MHNLRCYTCGQLLLLEDEETPVESGFVLSKRSLESLEGVHVDLQRIVHRAIEITDVDFVVIEGVRESQRQAELVKTGASSTMDSRHLTGHAVDVAAWVGGTVRWDWPLYPKIAEAFKRAAEELELEIEWGGDWTRLRDGPHFQLPWSHKD